MEADTLILGSNSPISRRVAETLSGRGHNLIGVHRGKHYTNLAGERDVFNDPREPIATWQQRRFEVSNVVCVADLHAARTFFAHCEVEGLERVVALSSNNVEVFPANPKYRALAEAEAWALDALPHCAVLQTTNVMGGSGDLIVTAMLRAGIKGRRFVVSGAQTLQQPVHQRDVADALCVALGGSMRGRWSVAGPDVVSYAGLSERVAVVTGAPVNLVDLPARLARTLGRAALPAAHVVAAAPYLPQKTRDHVVNLAQALRRAGVDRLPVRAPLPGFTPQVGVDATLRELAARLDPAWDAA